MEKQYINEEWKTLKDFPRYQISNYGRVRNEKQIIKQRKNNNGYSIVNFWVDHKPHTKTVHRQVALLFVDNPNNYNEVNHIDGNKQNNKADNLEWCTRSHNNAHALRNGLRKNPNPPALSPEQEKEARLKYRNGATLKDLGKIYNIHPDSMKKYVKGIHKNKVVPQDTKDEILRLIGTHLYTYKELAQIFDVSTGTIDKLVRESRA